MAAYSAYDGSKAWAAAVVNDPFEVTTMVTYAPEKLFFIGNTDSRIKSFNQTGNSLMTSSQMKNLHTPQQIAVSDKFILTFTKLLNQPNTALDVLNRGDGSYFYSYPFVAEMLSMYGIPGNKVYAITLENTQIDLVCFNLDPATSSTLKSNMQLSNPHIFFADDVRVFIKSDEGIYVLTTNNLQLNAIVSRSGISSASYDDLLQTVIYGADGKLNRTTLSGSSSVIANTGTDAGKIWIRYNK